MELAGWVVWILFAVWALFSACTFLFVNNPHAGIENSRTRIGLTMVSAFQILGMMIVAVAFLIYGLNKLHLLWVGPLIISGGMVVSFVIAKVTVGAGSPENHQERGYRFVPISIGIFFLGLAGLIIWFWGENFLILITGGLLCLFGLSFLKIGLFGSQKLIDEMNLKGELSEEGRDEWRKIHKLDD